MFGEALQSSEMFPLLCVFGNIFEKTNTTKKNHHMISEAKNIRLEKQVHVIVK